MHGLGKVLDVLGIEADHGHSSVIHHVNVVLLKEVVTLLLVESRKDEETSLGGHMVPCPWSFKLFQTISQQFSDIVHPSNHTGQLPFPFLH